MTDCFQVIFRQKKKMEQIEGLQSEGFFCWGINVSFDFPGSGKEGHEFNGLEPKNTTILERIYKISNSKGPTFALMVSLTSRGVSFILSILRFESSFLCLSNNFLNRRWDQKSQGQPPQPPGMSRTKNL